ncbi:MAG: hypothetical protein JSS83_19935 [Cyanobacteria bacterium SZAS LIN-3]|nr:hypothetical protein [Cyanobacteria bacterium SZAS LIN-3]MBS2009268.1 hypothetical protein [Cyanobacteria bacterium SZAS TMP-1]
MVDAKPALDTPSTPTPQFNPEMSNALAEVQALTARPSAQPKDNLSNHLAENTEGSALDKSLAESATLRRTVAFGEGLGYAVPGAIKAATHDLTHPMDLLEKVGMAATIGMGMRVLLPKTGAGKAIVGTIMGIYMVKDALHPVVNGWEESGKATNLEQVNKAAQHIGDGLGAFAWDAYVGSKVGLKAENLTGKAMDGVLGTARFSAFEKFKVDMDARFISRPMEAVLSPLARASGWASEKMVRKSDEPQIAFQEVKHKFAEVEAQNIAHVKAVDMHLKGVEGADGNRLGFSQTLDLLEQGLDPRKIASHEVGTILGQNVMEYPGNRVSQADAVISEALTKQGITASGTAGEAANSPMKAIMGPNDVSGQPSGFDKPSQGPAPGGDHAKPPTGDATAGTPAGATDKTGGGGTTPPKKPYVTKGEQEVNAENYAKLAAMNKTMMDAWTDKRVLIEDAKERFAGPVQAAITPEYKKMDPGYILPRNQMMQIASQIASEEDLKYVMPLFSRFSMAATQHISDGLSNTAAWKYQLDLMALETHSELVRNMKKSGIDPDVVLRSKNPAVFSISHDGGAGPHTMRQIDNVWNVDHVLYPRNMVDTRSTTASGIYGHELGHDQYGGILKFDESIREQVITDAVAKGLGSRATEKIHMPGVGDVTKQELIEAIFKAQADENTADIWGAAWTGHNSGGALGLLLQSLRKGGQLETRNVFGAEFKADDNPFGFEVHAFDALRPKIVAAVMKARANGDAKVIEYANALERYADEASKPGDYVFANMDNPGETVTIPRRDMEDVVPHLIDAQLNTKLSALQGHSFAEILPDLPANMAKMDILADLMVDAIAKKKKPSEIPFDVSQYSIIQVFGAGLPAASRLVAKGMDATEANTAVNHMSDYLRGLYHGNDPHVDPLKPSALQTIRLTSPKSFISGSSMAGRDIVHNTGQVLARTPQLGDWLASKSTSYTARVGVVAVDNNYRNAITAQSIASIDLTPKTVIVGQNDDARKKLNTSITDLTSLDKTKKEVLRGAERQ